MSKHSKPPIWQLRVLAWALLVIAAGMWVAVQPEPYIRADRLTARGTVEYLMHGRLCWHSHTGRLQLQRREGRELTANAVIILSRQGNPQLTRRPRLVAEAIEQAVHGKEHGLEVFAFCELERK